MTRLLKTIALISLGAVSGCVTMDSAKPAMEALKGQPLSAAIAKLGYPDSQMSIAGKKVYTWNNHDSGSYTLPTYNTATTYVNGQPIYSTVQGSRTTSYDYECKLKIIASQSDIIENFEWDGDIGGCEAFAMRLQKKS